MSGEDSEGKSKVGSGSESGGMSGSKASKMQSSGPGESQDSQEESNESEEEVESEDQDDLHDLPEEGEVREELIRAITDEFREYENLQKSNTELQQRIIKNEFNQRDNEVKQDTQLLNEHKYLNTLANVHQVRFNLKET